MPASFEADIKNAENYILTYKVIIVLTSDKIPLALDFIFKIGNSSFCKITQY